MTNAPSVPDTARNVLLLGPDEDVAADGLCQVLAAGEDPGRTRLLTISYLQEAEAYRDRWLQTVETPPAEMVVIEAQGQGTTGSGRTQPFDDETVVIAESPDNLTWLGIHTNEYLTRWHDTDDRIALCVDSLSVLLQYTSVERVYKFLHVLAGRGDRADATAHYHMNPAIHDDQAVNTMKQLCDTAVAYDTDTEEWVVRSR